MENIFKFNLYELTSIVKKEYNAKDFVAKQIWSWLYCKGSRNFDGMLNLSKKLRNDLQKIFNCDRPKVVKDLTSFETKSLPAAGAGSDPPMRTFSPREHGQWNLPAFS